MVKRKGKDNKTNLAEQVCTLQVSAGVFASAADADGLMLKHLVVKTKRRCSGEICRGLYVLVIWETLLFLKPHPNWAFPALPK